jgi:hypothetical protein
LPGGAEGLRWSGCEPVSPLGVAAGPTGQQAADKMLDIEDVQGKRIVMTGLVGSVRVHQRVPDVSCWFRLRAASYGVSNMPLGHPGCPGSKTHTLEDVVHDVGVAESVLP